MCVIAVYEAGLELNKTELQNCFDYNNDGAGLMYWDATKGKTHIKKGFFTFEEFWAEATKIPSDIHRVFHFRIATSGAIAPSTCHAFAVSDDYKAMGKANTYCDVGMVHNGILHSYTPKLGMASKHSDTMQFIKEMAYPLGNAIWKKQVQELLAQHTKGNKLVFLGNGGQVAMLGEFTESKESGAWYSNTSYQTYRTSWKTSYYDYDLYNYDDYSYDSAYDDVSEHLNQTTKTYEDFLKKTYPECLEGTVDTIDDDGVARKYYPVEVFFGKMDDDAVEEFIDEFTQFAYDNYTSVYDYLIKNYSVVFWVDYPSALINKRVNNKTIFAGDKDYKGA